MTTAVITLGVAVVLLGLLVVGLLRSHADVLRALHDAEIMIDPDTPRAPPNQTFSAVEGVADPGGATRSGADITGVNTNGDAMAVGVIGTGHRTLLAFLSSGCLTCHHFWSTFADPEATGLPDDIRLVIVTHSPGQESETAVAELAPPRIPVVMSSEAWETYQAPVSPYFCLVESTGAVAGEGASADWQQVRELMIRADRDQTASDRRASRLGGPDADIELKRAGILPGDPRLSHEPETP